MRKWILLIVGAGVILGAMAGLLLVGPRMKGQPNIRAYQARVPPPPAGVVPVEPALYHAEKPHSDPLAAGKVYYQYYCQMCHGASGDGNGPVGQSFMPAPTDLRAAKVQSLSDAQLLRAMLTGSGHEPAASPAGRRAVVEYIVLPEHRGYLALYVRSLGASEKSARAR